MTMCFLGLMQVAALYAFLRSGTHLMWRGSRGEAEEADSRPCARTHGMACG